MPTAVPAIEDILGADAASLLRHQCRTIPKESLHLPGPDFVERVHAAAIRQISLDALDDVELELVGTIHAELRRVERLR